MASDPKGFAVVLFIALATICAYLSFTNRLNGLQFAASLIASAFAVALIVNVDRLQDLFLKWGDREARVGLQQLRNEIFAKVEELQKVARGIATFTASSIASENRLAGEDHLSPDAPPPR